MNKLQKAGRIMAVVLWASIIPLVHLQFYISGITPPDTRDTWPFLLTIVYSKSILYIVSLACVILLMQGEVKRKEKLFIVFIMLIPFFSTAYAWILLIGTRMFLGGD